jgi:hypothetical protein
MEERDLQFLFILVELESKIIIIIISSVGKIAKHSFELYVEM